jgi:hypothetical protein
MPCWAESLGDCSDKLTREHLISEGMYPDQTLRVKGLSWCKDEFKEIPITNLVKKVLCRHHNSTISYVDQVGANTINAFREASRVREERAQMGPRRWRIERVQIDGYGLERWCLKTLVNFAAEGAHKIGRDSSSDGQPSPRISRLFSVMSDSNQELDSTESRPWVQTGTQASMAFDLCHTWIAMESWWAVCSVYTVFSSCCTWKSRD